MSTPLHLLILEDQPADAELMVHELRRAGFEPDWQRVETRAHYLAQLHQGLDVILADYALPHFDALHALYLLQERGLDVPFIIISGRISEEVAVECMKQGAADYLLKDRLARLGPAVTRALQEKKLRNEKRQTETALRESEARYRQAVENSPNPIFSVDREGIIQTWNRACERLFQYSSEGIIGQAYHKLLWNSQDRPAVEAMLAQVWQRDSLGSQDMTYRCKDGTQRFMVSRLYPLCDHEGSVQECVFANTDITERKRAEKALKESLTQIEQVKQEWESTADSLSQLVCLLDDQGCIIRANRTVEDWNLGPVAEVKGRGVHQLLHPGCTDPACYLETFWLRAWEALAQGQSAECEAEDRVLKRHLGVQVRPISAQADGESKKAASFAVVIVYDITERKRAEEQIQASLKEKEVLLKEIHHRVKNNLQIISSLLKLQSEYIQDKQTIEMFRESQNRVRSMALIHEKLYQSRDLAKIDLAEYIRNLTAYLFRSHGAHSAAITLKINVDDVSLAIDTAIPYGLIINELVSNSLKHAFPADKARSERSESKGEICIELCSDKGGRLTLIVSDNGVGLPTDLDFRDTESLGLQLVNMLTQQLEGTIELDRSGGTAFKIAFTEPE